MPHEIAKKLREMKNPRHRKNSFSEFCERFTKNVDDNNEPVEVVIKFASLDSHLQKKLLSLMRNIFEIGKAASKIYEGDECALSATYFCAISDPTDLVKTLSSFQTVLYSIDELPVRTSLFWPGEGTILSETNFTPTRTTVYCLHHDLHLISDAWHELSIRLQISLSTWSESTNVEQDKADNLPNYWRGQKAYRQKMNSFVSKIDHLISAMPQITLHMNAWAEERRELCIERENYEDILYGDAEEYIDYP
ncbi:hypothetical protein ACHAC9_20695 [Massilia sp. CMS3.1]|uniref:hypothetical protein n=1 Tax=Massilia sp. CMS3.1 TaxID=3373083 RepID=UPI003EE544BF